MWEAVTQEELIRRLAAWLQANTNTAHERAKLSREIFDGLAAASLQNASQQNHITAPNVVVEAVDAASGLLFRRYLEIEYDESDNGLRLIGEDISGQPAQIAFLSETALKRMHELRGKGQDAPRCGGHEHE